jgi:hypothetical protein
MIDFYNKYYSRFNLNSKIYVDVDFPKDRLIAIMQPYLLLYFNSIYSLIPERKRETEIIFKNMMIRFNKFNPQFGRKKYKISIKHTNDFKKKIVGKIIEFDDKHIAFNKTEYNNKNFLKDHLEYVNNYNILNIRFNNFLIILDETHYYFNNNQDEEDSNNQPEEDSNNQHEENNTNQYNNYNSSNNEYNDEYNDEETYTNDEETEIDDVDSVS